MGSRDAHSRKSNVHIGLGKRFESRQNGNLRYYQYCNASSDSLGFIEDQSGITAGNSMHSSWTSEDGNYLYSCRETNERQRAICAFMTLQIRHSRF